MTLFDSGEEDYNQMIITLTDYIGEEWVKVIDTHHLMSAYKAIKYLRENPSSKYTPDLNTAFRVFREIKPTDIKVIICSLCPYPDGSSDGIAFSCSKTNRLSPTLSSMYEGIAYDLGLKEEQCIQDPNLEYLLREGVLLLNMKLTVENNDSRSHSNIGWEDFILGVMKAVNRINRNITVCLWGADATSYYEKRLKALKIDTIVESHPVASAKLRTLWMTDQFSKINGKLKTPIQWIQKQQVQSG